MVNRLAQYRLPTLAGTGTPRKDHRETCVTQQTTTTRCNAEVDNQACAEWVAKTHYSRP
jgi:hypothetical protein